MRQYYDGDGTELPHVFAAHEEAKHGPVFFDQGVAEPTGEFGKHEITCPICGLVWTPDVEDPSQDVAVPICGCFGHFDAKRIDMPCNTCGLLHGVKCEIVRKMVQESTDGGQ